jgi:tryptophan-rich sensory protein
MPVAQSVLGLAAAAAVVFGAAGIGGVATARSVGTWYQTLAKPSFNPPDAVFGPVWGILYTLMALALWLVWRTGAGATPAVVCFLVQLALNVLWSLLFFGLRRPWLGLIDIVALWAAIVATIVVFARARPLAAWLLVPYLLWVSFATVLNAAIVWLNPGG